MKRIEINLKIAFRSLWNFKVRSLLAVFGVFLGTFSLIVVSNLSDSLALKTEQEVAALGKNLLIVRSGIVRRVGVSTQLLSTSTNLTIHDANALLEGSGFISDISPSSNKSFPVRHGNTMLSSVLCRCHAELHKHQKLPCEGGYLVEEEEEMVAKLAGLLDRAVSGTLGRDEFDRELREYWLNGLLGRAYVLGAEMLSPIHLAYGRQGVFAVLEEPRRFLERYNAALDAEPRRLARCARMPAKAVGQALSIGHAGSP